MKVRFKTNIDSYRSRAEWPSIDVVPRKGEFVEANNDDYFRSKRLPVRLEVCSVTYVKDAAVVELWFNETDYKLYNDDGKLLQRS